MSKNLQDDFFGDDDHYVEVKQSYINSEKREAATWGFLSGSLATILLAALFLWISGP